MSNTTLHVWSAVAVIIQTIVIVGGFGAALWRGLRFVTRWLDSNERNTEALQTLTSKVEDNTSKTAAASSATDRNTAELAALKDQVEAIAADVHGIDRRVAVLEGEVTR